MIRLKKPIKNLKNKALVLDRNVPIANFAKKMDDHRRRFVSQNIKCAKAGEELKRAENGMEELHAMMLGLLAASLKCNVASSAHYWPCCARNNLTCSMRNEWRYGFQGKAFCNIGKTCKDSRCNPSATQELGYTGETLTLH